MEDLPGESVVLSAGLRSAFDGVIEFINGYLTNSSHVCLWAAYNNWNLLHKIKVSTEELKCAK